MYSPQCTPTEFSSRIEKAGIVALSVTKRNKAAEAIIEHLLYGSTNKLTLSKTRITAIERAFRACNTFDEFCTQYRDEANDLETIQTGLREVEKQFRNGRKLQPCILMECNGLQTIANLFGMDVVHSVSGETVDNLPANIRAHLLVEGNNPILPRYIFENTTTGDFLLQYGAPGTCDAVACIDGVTCSIEFKDDGARGGERDLIYDERGTLEASDDVLLEHPEYREYIDAFNAETNMFDQLKTGRNYRLGDHHKLIKSFQTYLEKSGVELLLIVRNGRLMPILTDDVTAETSSGTPILSTVGSEIRPAGRNNRKVFVPTMLDETLEELGAETIGEYCEIDETRFPSGLGWINGRSGTTKRRLKLSRAFFVRDTNVEQRGTTVRFKRSSVQQSTCTISSHVRVNCGIDDLRALYPLKSPTDKN